MTERIFFVVDQSDDPDIIIQGWPKHDNLDKAIEEAKAFKDYKVYKVHARVEEIQDAKSL